MSGGEGPKPIAYLDIYTTEVAVFGTSVRATHPYTGTSVVCSEFQTVDENQAKAKLMLFEQVRASGADNRLTVLESEPRPPEPSTE